MVPAHRMDPRQPAVSGGRPMDIGAIDSKDLLVEERAGALSARFRILYIVLVSTCNDKRRLWSQQSGCSLQPAGQEDALLGSIL